MLRAGLTMLALAVGLFLIGFAAPWSPWFEAARLPGAALAAAGIGLLLLNHARTPDPGG